ncbi:MAG: hypothetical protein FD181_3482 [Prolixibacteraceae bacterium]|nr:MAG: hypothetical protein FD181_3482 [Prolixibacteraceae bacterium]
MKTESLSLLLAAFLFTLTGQAQNNPEKFFTAKDLTTVGVYYYPEHWDSTQWERDFKNMADKVFELNLPPGAEILIGEEIIKTAGVLVWRLE